MIAVIYDPADGRIIQTVQGAREAVTADPRPHIEVDKARDDYDVTHRVENGALVEISA